MTMKLRAFLLGFFAVAGVLPGLSGKTGDGTLTLLYWNIQNGMWDDQANNYDNFVAFVAGLDPDICVWTEAESRYIIDFWPRISLMNNFYFRPNLKNSISFGLK